MAKTPVQVLEEKVDNFRRFYEREIPTLGGYISESKELEKEHLYRAWREGVLNSSEGKDTDEVFEEFYQKTYG